MTTIHKNSINGDGKAKTSEQEAGSKFRWAAEFLAGPGGYIEKAEVVSDWFTNKGAATDDAYAKAQKEVDDYPYSRHRILKLIVEDEKGTITELSNAQHIIRR